MDIWELNPDDRIEVYTPHTGTYWGFITELDDEIDVVYVDEVLPAGPGRERVNVCDVVRVLSDVKRRWARP